MRLLVESFTYTQMKSWLCTQVVSVVFSKPTRNLSAMTLAMTPLFVLY